MATDLASGLLSVGAVNSFVGALTSRTLMLAELSLLLEAIDVQSQTDESTLRWLVVEENVCAKNSGATRNKTFRHLRELYALSNEVALWKALVHFWALAPAERPLLALLVAFAREPLLRLTWPLVAELPLEHPLTAPDISAFIERELPEHYATSTLTSLGKNCASAWSQSGHLSATSPKWRSRAKGGPASTTLALWLAHLEGTGPAQSFESRWATLLDASWPALDGWAFEAHRKGWLDYRRVDNVVALNFERLTEQLLVAF